MDREPEEFQFMGLIGIYKESFKIIFKRRKLFSKITLALILPLTFIFLAHTQVSELIFSKINHKYHHLHDSTLSELIAFFLFEAAYLVILLMFSLLSTSAVVYPIASIYTAKEVTFKKVMTFVPKVWKRLMITFLWSFIILFLYNVVEVVFLVLIILFVPGSTVRSALLIVLLVLYLSGVVYISIVWELASVISVLEDLKGIKAMIKSKELIKGKMMVACLIFVNLSIVFSLVDSVFETMVVHREKLGMEMWIRVLCGIVCFLLLMLLFLFGLVVQSVFYFVCKSYHHESVDKSLLADHLEVLCGRVSPYQRPQDIQLEQYDV